MQSIFFSGAHTLSGTTSVQQTFRVTKLIYHEQYTRSSLRNDVALLQLEEQIHASQKVNIVCLPPSESRIPSGTRCDITGNYFQVVSN